MIVKGMLSLLRGCAGVYASVVGVDVVSVGVGEREERAEYAVRGTYMNIYTDRRGLFGDMYDDAEGDREGSVRIGREPWSYRSFALMAWRNAGCPGRNASGGFSKRSLFGVRVVRAKERSELGSELPLVAHRVVTTHTGCFENREGETGPQKQHKKWLHTPSLDDPSAQRET